MEVKRGPRGKGALNIAMPNEARSEVVVDGGRQRRREWVCVI